jgi:hypothetical protein
LQKQAMVTSLQLDHKNTFINELKEKIKQQKEINLDKILKEEQLADNNFNGIQQIIQDVHPNFSSVFRSFPRPGLPTWI